MGLTAMLFFACATARVMPPQVRLDILVDFFDPVGPSLLVYHSGPADIKRFSFVVREGKDGPRVPLLHAGPSNVFAVLTQEGGAGIGGVTGRRKKKWGARSAGWANRATTGRRKRRTSAKSRRLRRPRTASTEPPRPSRCPDMKP